MLTFGLGIGAGTAIFSVVYGVLLRPLPYARPDKLVAVWERNVPRDRDRNVVSLENFESWRDRARSFTGMAALMPTSVTLAGGPAPERVLGAEVSAGYFGLLGVPPALGRDFDAGDESDGRAVILGDGCWKRRFGGDPGVIGKSITISAEPYTVVGVMPPAFDPPRFGWLGAQEVWFPMVATPEKRAWGRFLLVVARLRGQELAVRRAIGATERRLFQALLMTRSLAGLRAVDLGFDPGGVAVARVALPGDRYASAASQRAFFDRLLERVRVPALRAIVASLDGSLPLCQVKALPSLVDETLAADRFATLVLVAFAAAALLLAGVGVFGVFAGDVTRRRKEIGIRLALGARGSQVVVLLLRQALRRAAVGIAAGTALALALARAMKALLFGVRPSDPASLIAAAALVLVVALGATLVPAIRAVRLSPLSALREG